MPLRGIDYYVLAGCLSAAFLVTPWFLLGLVAVVLLDTLAAIFQ